MTRFSFSSLRARLLLLGFLAVIPALELIIVAHFEQRQLVIAKAREDTLKVAQFVARDYNDLIEGARQLLVALAQLPEVHSGQNKCSAFFANLLKQYQRYTNIAAVNTEGKVFCSGLPLTSSVNLADSAWFQHAMETRKFVVGEYAIGRISGKPSVTFAYPALSEEGHALGAVFAGLDLDWLAQLAGKSYLPAGTTLTLADRNGKILAQYPGPAHWVGKAIPNVGLLGTILAKREGVTEVNAPDGSRQLIGFAKIEAASERDFFVTVGTSRDGVFAEINRAFTRNLFWLAIVVLMVGAVTWIGSDMFILRHVNNVLGATKRLTAGDLSARTGPSTRGKGELQQLAHAFDEMAASLQKAEIEKADFTAMIVHDLRSPLTAVTGAASILEEGLAGPVNEEQKKWAVKIQAGARTLLDLVNDFLDLSKLEAGRIELNKEEVDLDQLIRNSLDNYLVLAKDKKISLNNRVAPALPRLKADLRRLDQVLANLLSNAIKFTREGGEIEVGAGKETSEEIKVWVKDNGVGIPAPELGLLFEKYRQTTSGKTANQKGTGLGLVICKMIVEAHGGKIWVESKEGEGTAFLFSLPINA